MEAKIILPELQDIVSDARAPAFARVQIIEKTPWMKSDDAVRVPNSTEWTVMCCIADVLTFDAYDGVLSVQPIVRHKWFDQKQKKWNGDIASTEIRPDSYMTKQTQMGKTPGLKDRFGEAIALYLKNIVAEGRDVPLPFLADRVYPEVLNTLIAKELKTVNAFAETSKTDVARIKKQFEESRLRGMASRVEEFRQKARDMLASLGVQAAVAA